MPKIMQGKDGRMSLSRTAYIATLTIVLIKVLLSGVVAYDITFGEADIAGMALLVAATGATYFGRENTKNV